jgi:hypothetical protein
MTITGRRVLVATASASSPAAAPSPPAGRQHASLAQLGVQFLRQLVTGQPAGVEVGVRRAHTRVGILQRAPFEQCRPLLRMGQADQQAQHRRLAAPGRPGDHVQPGPRRARPGCQPGHDRVASDEVPGLAGWFPAAGGQQEMYQPQRRSSDPVAVAGPQHDQLPWHACRRQGLPELRAQPVLGRRGQDRGLHSSPGQQVGDLPGLRGRGRQRRVLVVLADPYAHEPRRLRQVGLVVHVSLFPTPAP